MKKINLFKVLSVLLKIILSCVVLYTFFVLSKSFVVDTLNDYERYKDLRGVQNYGKECIATLVKADNDTVYYEYFVQGEKYTYVEENKGVESLDMKKTILYDVLEPELNICKDDIENIDSFYADKFKAVGQLYILFFVMAVGLGICWHLLNILYGLKDRKRVELYA